MEAQKTVDAGILSKAPSAGGTHPLRLHLWEQWTGNFSDQDLSQLLRCQREKKKGQNKNKINHIDGKKRCRLYFLHFHKQLKAQYYFSKPKPNE